MTPYDHARPVARKHDLVIQEVADEVLVYDLKTHQAHCLNQTAALVWKYCDGQKTVADITALVGQEAKIDEPAVWLAVQRLGKAGLLEERVSLPAGNSRLGRREAIRRLGIGSAVAVPIVMSIVAPTALAGCTATFVNGTACPAGDPAQCCSGCCSGNPTKICVNKNSLGIGASCSASCACASGCCKSNNSGGSGQNTCQNSGGAVVCFP